MAIRRLDPDETVIAPEDEGGVLTCSYDNCPQYDGKRCRVTGFRPGDVCEPAQDLAAQPPPPAPSAGEPWPSDADCDALLKAMKLTIYGDSPDSIVGFQGAEVTLFGQKVADKAIAVLSHANVLRSAIREFTAQLPPRPVDSAAVDRVLEALGGLFEDCCKRLFWQGTTLAPDDARARIAAALALPKPEKPAEVAPPFQVWPCPACGCEMHVAHCSVNGFGWMCIEKDGKGCRFFVKPGESLHPAPERSAP